MHNFSCTAVFVSAFMVTAAAGYGQSQATYQQQTGQNFYITTPQTGAQQVTRGNNHAAAPVAAASRNTRSQTKSPQASAQPAYSVQQVSYSPARKQAQQTAAANYYVAPANYYSNSTTAQASPHTVSTSVQGYNNQQPTQQTINPPAFVSNASGGKKGILSRLLHRQPSTGQQRTGAIKKVSNLAGRAKQSVSYRASKLAGSMQQGVASWYGKDWHGKKTANGERYDMDSMTAAHKTLPFGTVVRVQNERNGRECMVRINNRGPFTKGRVLDLSRAAARQLDMVGSGVAKIKMEVVGRS